MAIDRYAPTENLYKVEQISQLLPSADADDGLGRNFEAFLRVDLPNVADP